MTREEAIKMAKAKLKCLENDTSGSYDLCDNDCENCILNYDQGNMGQQKEWLNMLINDAETVEQFENAYIITGGRLNGRAHAYKCGLEEGKRKVTDKIYADIQKLRGCSCSCSDGIIDDIEDILDKCRAEMVVTDEKK